MWSSADLGWQAARMSDQPSDVFADHDDAAGEVTGPSFTVTFSETAYAELEELADWRDKTMAEVVRDAISLAFWWHGQEDAGNKVLIESPDGRVREVSLR
jgi:hypothetical protein